MPRLEFIGPTGQYFLGTVERLSDGFYKDNSSSPNFSDSYTFDQRAFFLVEGAQENAGSYRPNISFSDVSSWGNDVFYFRVHESGALVKTVAAQLFSLYDGVEVPLGFERTLSDLYHSEIQFTRDTTNASQEYTAIFFKSGNVISGSLGGVSINVVSRADGSTIFSSAMTKVGNYAIYKADTTNPANFVSLGEAAIAVVTGGGTGNIPVLTQATIFGRDS